jgi:glycosyltransferase involved in cell wall biosynthesis
MTPTQDVYLVIPCFRESNRLGPFLEQLCPAMAQAGAVQIRVVEDGGGPEEQRRMDALVSPFRDRFPFVLPVLHLEQNLGKGGAVYAGWAEAQTRWLAFSDADGSCSASEIARMIELARTENKPARAYFASRVKMLGRTVTRFWYRHLMGHVYARLVDHLLNITSYDTQCGLKLVPRESFQRLQGRLTIHRYAFDVELLIALQCVGTEVVEVPIDWHETPGGKLNLVSEPWRMLSDVLKVRAHRAAGHYSV